MADSSSGDPSSINRQQQQHQSATGAHNHHPPHHHHPHSNSYSNSYNRPHLHLSASSLMRAYLDSLPDRVSTRRELTSFHSCFSRLELANNSSKLSSNNSDTAFALLELKSAASVGLSVATLVQCFGHVSGCHLSVAITLGLVVSGRVSTVRLVVYLLAQIIGSLAGGALVYALFGAVPPMAAPVIVEVGLNSTTAAQVFGFEFMATFLVVLAYLANADASRMDLGFKALSIGLAYSLAHLFAFSSTGASFSPARALAASLFSGNWCLHWVYWVSPLVGGLFGGVTYEYVGSIKPVAEASSLMAGGVLNSTELKHQQNYNATPSRASTHSVVTSPMSNYPQPGATLVHSGLTTFSAGTTC
ncbi:hypothetical protein TYRP_005159 [Tyrophagus putrescentiae]|nr:hypothetical protein TYRP_005159 [Tyrophagus putrescentiae]